MIDFLHKKFPEEKNIWKKITRCGKIDKVRKMMYRVMLYSMHKCTYIIIFWCNRTTNYYWYISYMASEPSITTNLCIHIVMKEFDLGTFGVRLGFIHKIPDWLKIPRGKRVSGGGSTSDISVLTNDYSNCIVVDIRNCFV